ncbi:hypothetical protein ACODT5_43620 [Streptomyces sp. 5.8]|uniref:hypothetical protein n=1 Tax=Streptomyces sp. 5.8 TaxID=3406571 RepID=UPI003BB753FE
MTPREHAPAPPGGLSPRPRRTAWAAVLGLLAVLGLAASVLVGAVAWRDVRQLDAYDTAPACTPGATRHCRTTVAGSASQLPHQGTSPTPGKGRSLVFTPDDGGRPWFVTAGAGTAERLRADPRVRVEVFDNRAALLTTADGSSEAVVGGPLDVGRERVGYTVMLLLFVSATASTAVRSWRLGLLVGPGFGRFARILLGAAVTFLAVPLVVAFTLGTASTLTGLAWTLGIAAAGTALLVRLGREGGPRVPSGPVRTRACPASASNSASASASPRPGSRLPHRRPRTLRRARRRRCP